MKRLGKKNTMQDGTMIAFACPCDCNDVCFSSCTCSTCVNSAAYVGIQATGQNRIGSSASGYLASQANDAV